VDAGSSEVALPALEDLLPEGIPDEVTAAIASETTSDVVKTLLGLVALLGLAWIASHERVRRLEERLAITRMMTSGLPFVFLGLLARAPGIEVLSDDVVTQLTPLLQFGLGWIGFHTGFQLDSRSANDVPRGSATTVIVLTVVPFVLLTLLCGLCLWLLGLGDRPRGLARDAVMLGLAGALSAPSTERLARAATPRAAELVRTVGLLDDAVGVVAFACLAAWLRPTADASGWSLPEVGWVFVTFGMATVLGLVTYVALRGTDSSAEKASILLGAVCLTTGLAATFSLPPLVVCFLAGAILRNLPGDDKQQLEEGFARLERPIYHLFLLIVGALWRPEAAAGWALLPVFLLARTAGRWGGARILRSLPPAETPESLATTSNRELVVPPMGPLAIAFVITAQTLYESPSVRAMVTAVVVGSITLEIALQAVMRRKAIAPSAQHTGDGGAS
jgi:Kef-type K+ transport system membrane component KefB